MLNDTINEFTSAVSKRFGNPFVINFMFSWAFINYKAVLVMFSSTPISQKLTVLEKEIWTSDYVKYGCGFIAPLAVTILILYALPFLVTHLEIFNAKVEKNRTEGKYKITDTIPLDPVEGARLKKENRELSHNNDTLVFDIKIKENEIARLREQILTTDLAYKDNESKYKEAIKKSDAQSVELSSALSNKEIDLSKSREELQAVKSELAVIKEKLSNKEQEIKELKSKTNYEVDKELSNKIFALQSAAKNTLQLPPQSIIDAAKAAQSLQVNKELSELYKNTGYLKNKKQDDKK